MTQAAAQAAQFFEEVAEKRVVWLLRGPQGFPTSRTPEGHAMPVWSLESRAEAVRAKVMSYRPFRPTAVSWDEFRDRWLPDLAREGLRLGVNWSGPKAVGYDFDAATIRDRVEAAILRQASGDIPQH